MEITLPLPEITCHMGSHPVVVTFPRLPQSKPVLSLATSEECKAELTWLAVYLPKTATCLRNSQK